MKMESMDDVMREVEDLNIECNKKLIIMQLVNNAYLLGYSDSSNKIINMIGRENGK